MIKSVSISSKGNYSKITFARESGSDMIDMTFSRHNSATFASYKLEDLLKALSLLCNQEVESDEC